MLNHQMHDLDINKLTSLKCVQKTFPNDDLNLFENINTIYCNNNSNSSSDNSGNKTSNIFDEQQQQQQQQVYNYILL